MHCAHAVQVQVHRARRHVRAITVDQVAKGEKCTRGGILVVYLNLRVNVEGPKTDLWWTEDWVTE